MTFFNFLTKNEREAFVAEIRAAIYVAQLEGAPPGYIRSLRDQLMDTLHRYDKMARVLYYALSTPEICATKERFYNFFLNSHAVRGQNQAVIDLLIKKAEKRLNAQWRNIEKMAQLRREKLQEKMRLKKMQNFTVLDIEECQDESSVMEDEEIFCAFEAKRKSKFSKYQCMLRSCRQRRFNIRPIERSINLMRKIRQYILELQNNRKPRMFRLFRKSVKPDISEETPLLPIPACFESDEPKKISDSGGENTLDVSVASNVAITSDRGTDSDRQAPVLQDLWTELSSSDIVFSPHELLDRWFEVKTFKWTKDDHDLLWKMRLPIDALSADSDMLRCSHKPLNAVFKNFTYFKSDIEICVQINANKFQIGQLIVGWFYNTSEDYYVDKRFHPSVLSQTLHGLVTANISNQVTLRIPFNYYAPYLRMRNINTMKMVEAVMGTLVCQVLNKLSVPKTGPSYCTGVVMIRFCNPKFTGMIDSGLGYPPDKYEQDCFSEGPVGKVIGDTVGNVVSSFLGEPNRDNPPDPRPGQYFIPVASHSWSVGNGLSEPLQVLRLDGRGQVPYTLYCKEDEMLISNISSKYGYVNTIDWTTSHHAGDLLFSCDAAPIIEKKYYYFIDKTLHGLRQYYLPPVAVMSSLFQYWRGMIKFRFDVVASQFHTGRLLIAYIPGISQNIVPTLAQAKSSTHIIYTLNEQQSFTYEVPYIANVPFWNRQYTGGVTSQIVPSPSRLFLFVLNDLIPMESVTSNIYINMYMSSGSDFEVAVPVQPSIGTNFNSAVIYTSSDAITALAGYSPYYFGTYYGFLNSSGLCARDAQTSGKVSYFDSKFEVFYAKDATKCVYYKLYDTDVGALISSASGKLVLAQYGVLVPDGNYGSLLCIALNEDSAKQIAIGLKSGKSPLDMRSKFYPVYGTTDNTYTTGNPLWVPIVVDIPSTLLLEACSEGGDKSVVRPVANLKSTGSGLLLFGESFISLKDLCRRYQLYANLNMKVDTLKITGQCAFTIPILPQGLYLDIGSTDSVNEIYNKCRDGHIPVIASGFRYYRGGMRFRIVLPASQPMTVWVQHRPDRQLTNWSASVCKSIDSAQGCMNHSYASYLQLTSVNGVVEFEVPYYSQYPQLMLQYPNPTYGTSSRAYSLGELSCGFVLSNSLILKDKDLTVQMFYSLADDMRFNTFQGFAPVVLLDDISEPVTKCIPEGPFSWRIGSSIKDALKGEAKEMITEVVGDAITPNIERVQEVINNVMTTNYKEKILKFFSEETVRSILGHLVHILLNPKVVTTAWSICNIFVECGLICVSAVDSFLKALQGFLTYVKSSMVSTQPQPTECAGTVEMGQECLPESPRVKTPQDSAQGLIAAMWAALCITVKCSYAMPSNMKDLSKFLVTDMANIFKSTNFFFTFLGNMVGVWERMYDCILTYLYPRSRHIKELGENHAELKVWVEEVLFLTSAEVKRRVPYDVSLQQRVYDAVSYGALLLIDDVESLSSKVYNMLNNYYKQITKVHETMKQMGIDPHVRKLPFSVMCFGQPGIGKSHMVSEIISAMFKAAKIVSETGTICVVNPTDKYWNQCDRQPALVMDDLYMIEEGEMLQLQVSNVVALCSPVPFTPPMAALEDKKMRYNPDIVWMNTNKPFPRFDKYNMDAIYRRRNVLIKVEHIDFDTEGREGCYHCIHKVRPESVEYRHQHLLEDYHHLKFYFAIDVRDPKTSYNGPYTYKVFKEKMIRMFIDNRTIEHKKFMDRLTHQNEVLQLGDAYCAMPLSERIARHKQYMLAQKNLLTSKTISAYISVYCKDLRAKIMDNVWVYFSDLIGKDTSSIRDVVQRLQTTCVAESPGNDEEKVSQNPFDDVLLVDDDYYQSVIPGVGNEMEDIDELLENIDIDVSINQKLRHNKSLKTLEDFMSIYSQDIEKIGVCSLVRHLYVQQKINKTMFEEVCVAISYELEDSHITTYQILKIFEPEFDIIFKDIPIYKRTWTDLYTYMIRQVGTRAQKSPAVIKTDVACCNHLLHDIVDINMDCNRKFETMDSQEYSWHPCKYSESKMCIMSSVLFYRLVMHRWLSCKPLRKMQYVRHQYHLLPMCFAENLDWLDFPDMTTWISLCKTAVEGFYSKYLEGAVKKVYFFFSDMWPYIKVLLQMMGIYAVAGGAIYLSKYVAPAPVAVPQQWTERESAPYTQRVSVTATRGVVSSRPQSNSQQTEAVIKKLKDNFFFITAIAGENVVEYTCLGLFNRKVLILCHYVDEILAMDNPQIYGRYGNMSKTVYRFGVKFDFINIKKNYYNYHPNQDHVISSNFITFDLPTQFTSQVKDITKFIATDSDHSSVISDTILVEIDKVVYIRSKRDNLPYFLSAGSGITPVKMDTTYTYPKHGRGMCGSILLSPNLARPIIGMHVAGVQSKNLGIAEILSYEMFKPFEAVKTKFVEPKLGDLDLSTITLSTAILPKGVMPPQLVLPQSKQSSIVPSIVQGVFPVRTQPNPLSRNDPRLPPDCDPMKLGCEHLGKPPQNFPSDVVEAAGADLQSSILMYIKPLRSEVGVLTLRESILGIPNISEYKDLEWNTSAGHPLRCVKTKGMSKGKKFLFDLEYANGKYDLKGVHPELLRLIDVDMSMRKQNIKPFTVFVDSLKDTVVPIEKCSIPGKTRIFSCSPIQFQIAFRMYFQDFMCAYRSARFDCEHMIGIDPQSLEWTHLSKRLGKFGDHIVAGDYKNFGPGLMKTVAYEASKLIVRWYQVHGSTEEEDQIRRIMLQEIIDCYHLCENLVYITLCGIPSGSPITTELNSLVNSLYIRCVYKLVYPHKPLSRLREEMQIYTYGDDILISLSPEIKDEFNLVVLSDKFNEFDIIFTNEDKTMQMMPYKPLSQCSFLKRGFVSHARYPGVIIGPLDKVSVEGAINWVNKRNDPVTNVIDCARSVLCNAVEHGRQYYEECENKIFSEFSQQDISCSFSSFEELDTTRYGKI